MMSYTFRCYGHPNITSKHRSTLEFTSNSEVSPRGDCIIGVKASSNLLTLPLEIKSAIRKNNSKIKIIMKAGEFSDEIKGKGHPNLSLSDENAMIVRTSNYVCSKTLMIQADKAANDIFPGIKNLMRFSSTIMEITIYVISGEIETSKHA